MNDGSCTSPALMTLRKAQRVCSPADFKRIYAARKSVRVTGLTIVYLANGLAFSRLGLSVSTKNGNAVRRNRIKRVLRAAFRAARASLPAGFDYILIPNRLPPDVTTESVKEILAEAASVFARKGLSQRR